MLAFLLVMRDLQITGVVCRSKGGVEDCGMGRGISRGGEVERVKG